MPQTRVGDTWTFDVPSADLPHDTPVRLELGQLPPEDYHIMLVARVIWDDPAGAAEARSLNLSFDVDGFDLQGNLVSEFDSGINIQLNRAYDTRPSEHYDQPLVAQSSVTIPPDMVLKLSAVDQSTSVPPSPVRLEECRVIATVVTPKV